MAFFGSAPSKAAAPSFSPPPTKQSNPLFEAPTKTTSNPLFGATPATSSGPTFGEAPSTPGGSFFGQPEKVDSGFLLFDNADHSGDGAGKPMDERGIEDEAANVYKEIEALGYDITTTDATDAATLETLLAEVATFLLPEAEGGSGFPDGDTVFNFVKSGGNLLFFGGGGTASQLNYINDTFELSLTGAYRADGDIHNLNENGVGGAFSYFLDGPDTLYGNNGSSYLDIDSLPEDATVIYGQEGDNETLLATIPSGDGQVVFVGWDFYSSSSQDGGWDEVFATVVDVTAETMTEGAPLFGVASVDTSSPFFG